MPVTSAPLEPDALAEEFPQIPPSGGLWPWLLAGLLLALWGVYLIAVPGPDQVAPVRVVRTPGPTDSASSPPERSQSELSVAFVESESSTFGQALKEMDTELRERTHGKLSLRPLPDGKIQGREMGELELIQLVHEGELPMALVTTSPLSNLNPGFDVLDLPFVLESYAQADRVMEGPLGQQIFQGLDSHELHGLAYMELGFRIFSSRIPLCNVADFKGKKIRVMESPTCIRMARAFGSVPVPAPPGKILEMSREGTIDAADRTYPSYWERQLYTANAYITETRHIYSVKALIINLKVYESLSPEERTALEETARSAAARQRQAQRRLDQEIRSRCLERGIQIFPVQGPERLDFIQACAPMLEEFRRGPEGALLDRLEPVP